MQIKTIACLLTSLLFAGSTLQVQAQQRHEFVRGDMPPGMAAQLYQMSDRSLAGHTQAVQLVAPGETVIEIGDGQGVFSGGKATQMSVAMGLGFVYRFKLSNLPIPGMERRELYPSIEVIGKLNPPAGMESQFPVQVVVTRSDLKLALKGQMITRIIYLEDPRGPLPHRHRESVQPSFDVSSDQDPLRAAEKLGQPMAIFRLGSRVPLQNDSQSWFNFGVASPMVLPDPGQAGMESIQPGSQTPTVGNLNAPENFGPARLQAASDNSEAQPAVVAAEFTSADASESADEETVRPASWQENDQRSAQWSPAPSMLEVEVKVKASPAKREASLGPSGRPMLRRPNQL
jgi:hypothetical protein